MKDASAKLHHLLELCEEVILVGNLSLRFIRHIHNVPVGVLQEEEDEQALIERILKHAEHKGVPVSAFISIFLFPFPFFFSFSLCFLPYLIAIIIGLWVDPPPSRFGYCRECSRRR